MLKNKKSVIAWLNEYGIDNYTLNPDLSVSVHTSVDVSGRVIGRFPIVFREVLGGFNCSRCELVSLVGAPELIKRSFTCAHNFLKDLEGCPQKVNLHFICNHNDLQSIEFSPTYVGGQFACTQNPGLNDLQQANGDFSNFYLKHLDFIKIRNEQQLLRSIIESTASCVSKNKHPHKI